jgi:hypothetical protein
MLTKKQIEALLSELNDELAKKSERGEVGLVGGAAMCLVYNARASTRDIDAIFAPAKEIRKICERIAERYGLPSDWLNDAVKGYLVGGFDKREVFTLSHLRVWTPEPKYLLSMKCLSARWDSHDRDDVKFLIEHLKIKKAQEVFSLIEHFYPKNKIPPKTQFFIEELFDT